MIGSRRMAFPRIEALTFWLLMAAGVDPARRRSSSAASRPAGRATRRSTTRRTLGMDSYIVFFALVGISMMPARGEHDRDDHHDARAGADLDAAADLRLGRRSSTAVLMVLAAPVLIATLADGGARPHGRHDVLHPDRRRQPVPVREPLLVLRAPGGLHPRAAGLRDRARDAAGLRAQAALGLPARGRRDARRRRSCPSSSGSTTCS